jgi:hypothetical protein
VLLRDQATIFGLRMGAAQVAPFADIKALQAKIGELTPENGFLEGALSRAMRNNLNRYLGLNYFLDRL